jgi:hypothetical protein
MCVKYLLINSTFPRIVTAFQEPSGSQVFLPHLYKLQYAAVVMSTWTRNNEEIDNTLRKQI